MAGSERIDGPVADGPGRLPGALSGDQVLDDAVVFGDMPGPLTRDPPTLPGPPVPVRGDRGQGTAGLVLALGAVALACTAGAVRLPGGPPLRVSSLLVVLLLLALASALGVQFRARGETDTLDLFEAALAVGLLALPVPALLVLVVIAKGVTLAARGIGATKTVFNVVQWACAAAAGGLVLSALRAAATSPPHDLVLVVPALCVVTVVNAGAVLLVLHRRLGRPLSALTAGAAANAGLSLALGVVFAAVWVWRPAAWPVLPLGLLAVHLLTRAWVQQQAGTARLVGLQRAAAALAGPQDDGVQTAAFLRELRRAFSCRGAQLHLLPAGGAAPPGGEVQGWRREQAGPGPVDDRSAALVAALVRRGRSVRLPDADRELTDLLAAAGWRDALATPVRSQATIVGLLCTHDRQGWSGFESGELTVLEAVASVLGEALNRGALAAVVREERAALRRSESRWRALVQNASDLVLVVDGGTVVDYASPASRRVLDRPSEALLGRDLLRLVHPGDREKVRQVLAELRAAGRGSQRRFEMRMASAGGSQRTLEVVASDLLGDGAVDGVVLNARDVTERRRVEGVHADQARVLELVALDAPLPQTLGLLAGALDAQSQAVGCALLVSGPGCPSVLAAPGLSEQAAAAVGDLLARTLGHVSRSPDAAAPDRAAPPATLDVALLPGDPASRALLQEGVRAVRLRRLASGAEPGVTGALAVCHRAAAPPADDWLVDSTARVATLAVDHFLVQRRLAHQAAHDTLTDLPNRSVFLDRLGQALASGARGDRQVLVMFLDLDRFKVVNDSLGHRAGDVLLRAVAARLRQAVRPGDTVARFGGDEFTMLCEGIQDEAHAVHVVQRIQEVLARPFPLGDSELFVTTSIGIAMGSDSDASAEVLVEDADAAMYRAKERGGNRFELFDAAMRARALQRLDTQSALHHALERSEFRVAYQPTIDLRGGAVVGVEALVRWDRGKRGLVLPDAFIPLAEETGLILPIGAQVLQQACEQAVRWGAGTGGDVSSVNVNLSTRQLTDPGLVALVRRVLAQAGAAPGALTLEITESALIQDVPASTHALHELKELGVRLMVDDFGTGYSSLTYLQRFPVDGVKVDRSFVAGLGRTPDADAIVRSVVGLAHSLGLVAVAEGVETAEQVQHLREVDCDVAQGFYLGRPVAAEEVSLAPRVLDGAGRSARPALSA